MAQNWNGAKMHATEAGRGDGLHHVRYEELLRAIGSYIDQNGYNDVIVTQIPDGILLKGTVVEHGTSGAVERINAVLFTDEDIVRLLEEGVHKRGSGHRLRPHFD